MILNRSDKELTPYEQWFGNKPDVSRLRVFGSKAFGHIPKVKRTSKMGPKSEPGLFIGYGDSLATYKLYDPTTGEVKMYREVTFDETSDRSVSVSLERDSGELLSGAEESEVEGEETPHPSDAEQEKEVPSAPRKRGRPKGSRNKPKDPPQPHQMSRRNKQNGSGTSTTPTEEPTVRSQDDSETDVDLTDNEQTDHGG